MAGAGEGWGLLVGQVVHIRRVSRRLMFFDMHHTRVDPAATRLAADLPVAPREVHGSAKRRCVMCKVGCMEHEDMKLARSVVRLGDVVEVSGHFEEPPDPTTTADTTAEEALFIAARVPCVRRRWDGPGAFVPVPPVRPKAKQAKAKGGGGHNQPQHTGTGTAHLDALLRGVCKSWFFSGTCPHRAATPACPHTHPPITAELKARRLAAVQAKSLRRRQRNRPEGEGPHWQAAVSAGGEAGPSGHEAGHEEDAEVDGKEHMLRGGAGLLSPKARRAVVFADWLVAHFSAELLGRGGGTLDVAGGRGALAFELQCVRGIPTTLVDPRPFKLSKPQVRFLKGAAAQQSVLPRQFQTILEREALCELEPDEAAWRAVLGSSVVVAMHPDQATEPAIDFAIEHGLPFAVVPCCVFGRERPGRRLLDGTEVTSYEHFLQYLCEKAVPTGRVASLVLDFAGRNTVLWWGGVAR